MLHIPPASPFKAPNVYSLSASVSFVWIAEQRLFAYTLLTDWFS